jgi:N-acyl-D-amino-acid deacylase
MFDLIIKNGLVFDGTGAPASRQDIGIRGDSIEAVDDLSRADADTVIDAAGKNVCPGFIDAHSHSDTYLLIEPSAPSKVFQGITTEVVGNCGASAAPRTGEYHMPSDWADKEYPGTWSTVAEYRELLEQARPAPNVVLLVGHGALRAGVVGYGDKRLELAELERMTDLLDCALDEGARGLSTGLIYAPGMFADEPELLALTQLVAKYDGIYTSHMRSEGRGLLDAIEETIAIGDKSEVRVQVSHLKAAGRGNWGLADAAIELVHDAIAAGKDVAADRYPYTSGCTELDVVFPDWAAAGGREKVMERLRTTADRERLRDDLIASRPAENWADIIVGSTEHPDNARYRGMPLVDVAADLGVSVVEAILHLTETDHLKTTAFFSGMNEDNMWKILAQPFVMLGTDASLRAPEGPLSHDYPHPRAYGSFPRFLRASLDGRTVGPAEAIRKMTSLAAERFRLRGRGVIRQGYKADIVVFDPNAITDKSTYASPHELSIGIEQLLVNGVVTIDHGKLTGNRAGTFL